MPLMLRAGAKSVVGLELNEDFIRQAKVVQRVFEWRDMRSYNLTLHHADMREILDKDFGEFDIVTSLCTLYYLTEEDMERVVRRVSEMTPMMIVQANNVTRGNADDNKAEKSSTVFIEKLLNKNGYPNVNIIAPNGFSRPLIIAERVS